MIILKLFKQFYYSVRRVAEEKIHGQSGDDYYHARPHFTDFFDKRHKRSSRNIIDKHNHNRETRRKKYCGHRKPYYRLPHYLITELVHEKRNQSVRRENYTQKKKGCIDSRHEKANKYAYGNGDDTVERAAPHKGDVKRKRRQNKRHNPHGRKV